MSKVLLFISNANYLGKSRKTGYDIRDLSQVYYSLINLGNFPQNNIEFASIKGGQVDFDQMSLVLARQNLIASPFVELFMIDESVQERLENTKNLSELKTTDYKCIVFCEDLGGTFDFIKNKSIQQFSADFFAGNGVICANGHGCSGFLNAKLLSGDFLVKNVNLCCSSKTEEVANKLDSKLPFILETKLIENGAVISNKLVNVANVVNYNNRILTGQNTQSSATLYSQLATLIGTTVVNTVVVTDLNS